MITLSLPPAPQPLILSKRTMLGCNSASISDLARIWKSRLDTVFSNPFRWRIRNLRSHIRIMNSIFKCIFWRSMSVYFVAGRFPSHYAAICRTEEYSPDLRCHHVAIIAVSDPWLTGEKRESDQTRSSLAGQRPADQTYLRACWARQLEMIITPPLVQSKEYGGFYLWPLGVVRVYDTLVALSVLPQILILFVRIRDNIFHLANYSWRKSQLPYWLS